MKGPKAQGYARQQLLHHLETLAAERVQISDKGAIVNSKALEGVEATDLTYVGVFTGDDPEVGMRFKVNSVPDFEFVVWLFPNCGTDFGYQSVP
jgi:hypothetical protein